MKPKLRLILRMYLSPTGIRMIMKRKVNSLWSQRMLEYILTMDQTKMLMTLPFWKYQISALLNPTAASTATMLHVSQQSMLLMVEPVGPVDGVPSDLVGGCLRNKKKLAFILWTMNIVGIILNTKTVISLKMLNSARAVQI